MRLLLANQDPVGGAGEVDLDEIVTEPSRPLTELLEGWFGDGPLVQLLGGAVDAVSQVIVIIVVAAIAVLLLRRAIVRGVRRASSPDTPRGRRLRQRVGLLEEGRSVHSLRRAQRAEAMGALARSVVGLVVWTIAVFTILGTTFGINLGPLVAGAGIIGIAFGFGAQDLVKDFLSGVFMLIEDQYGVGDLIDVGEASGTVEAITLRTTRIRDVTGTLWHIPNGEIARVGNMSQEWSRALLDVRVSHGTDVDSVIALIEQVGVEMSQEASYREQFLDVPDVWGVEEIGPDAIDIRMVIKTQPAKQFAIARELRRRIKAAFDAAGVEIPVAQRSIRIRHPHEQRPDPPEVPAPIDPVAARHAIEHAVAGDRGPEVLEGQDLPDPPDPARTDDTSGADDGPDDGR